MAKTDLPGAGWWDVRYGEASKRASDAARQLAFAGLAAIWVLGGNPSDATAVANFPNALKWAGLLVVVFLALDALTLLWIAGSAGWWARYLRKRARDNEDLPTPVMVVQSILYWSRLLALFVGLLVLALFVITQSGLTWPWS